MRVARIAIPVFLLVLAAALACGDGQPSTGGTRTPSPEPTPTGEARTPSAEETPTGETSTPSAEETPTDAEILSGVLVQTDKEEYQQNEEIAVTITNDLDMSITTFNQQSFCTIVRLEIQAGTDWSEVAECSTGAPSVEVTLEPGTETVVTLPALSPGTYRASLLFSLGPTFNFGESFVASSAPFGVP